ncbi:7462_t:CDS:2, partial [Dentiscutata heterogama]
ERHNFHKFKLHSESSSADVEAINTSLPTIITSDYIIASYQIEELEKDKIRITIALIANADNTSIITLFKLHYCHLQLQYSINLDKASENDIYKAYIKSVILHDKAGLPISVSPITNDSEIVEENPVEAEELVEKLQQQINVLYIHSSISIENWLNPESKYEVH